MYGKPIACGKPQIAPLLGYEENLVEETHCSRKNQPIVAARRREGESEKTKPPN